MRPILLLPLSLLVFAAGCASGPTTQKQKVKAAFDAADQNHDEQLDEAEFASLPLKGVDFAELDSDLNARISLAELESFLIYRRVKAEGNRSLRELQSPSQRRY